MKKIFCFLFGHNTITITEFHPSIYAKVVTKFVVRAKCKRCGETWYDETNYDPITGRQI